MECYNAFIFVADCPLDKSCRDQKCVDPCASNICGENAQCRVISHSPICTCPPGFTGDPFYRCSRGKRNYHKIGGSKLFTRTNFYLCRIPVVQQPLPTFVPEKQSVNPCIPNPCGPNSDCRSYGETPSCSCKSGFFGSPPNCRVECVTNPECSSVHACIQNRCQDPCPGACGYLAQCRVIGHNPTCFCPPGYEGDPFRSCEPKRAPPTPAPLPTDPCHPNPCGINAVCRNRNGAASCQCIPETCGDPYVICKPECVTNDDCPFDKACSNNKCVDVCVGTCGTNAICQVVSHVPICTCPPGYEGDAFVFCRLPPPKPTPPPVRRDPCNPSPCGPYSQCVPLDNTASCSCLPTYIGSPPQCRPECLVNSDCPLHLACSNQKCIDPCPGSCGFNALCRVQNHAPICSCPPDMTGDPFYQCSRKFPKIIITMTMIRTMNDRI